MVALVAVIHTIVFFSFASAYVEQLARFIARFFFGQQQHDRLGNAFVFDYGSAFISPLGSGWHGPSLLLVCVTARHDWIM